MSLFKDKNLSLEELQDAIKSKYDIVSEIVDLAEASGCKIYYPFQGYNLGPFRVLSPSRYAYAYLLPQFDKTPEPDKEAIVQASMWLGKQVAPSPFAEFFEKAVAKAQTWIRESWNNERLKDNGITSASNESSVVLFGDFGNDRRVLLTGDAGANALSWAADYADSVGIPMRRFEFVQIPHHGSRRNVGPTILNRVLGDIAPEGSGSRFTAFVSAPKSDDTHPRKMVLNAFIRRGAKVIATQGTSKIHYGGFPKRADYLNATPLSFSSSVEAYD
jgi:hypothetical protein